MLQEHGFDYCGWRATESHLSLRERVPGAAHPSYWAGSSDAHLKDRAELNPGRSRGRPKCFFLQVNQHLQFLVTRTQVRQARDRDLRGSGDVICSTMLLNTEPSSSAQACSSSAPLVPLDLCSHQLRV